MRRAKGSARPGGGGGPGKKDAVGTSPPLSQPPSASRISGSNTKPRPRRTGGAGPVQDSHELRSRWLLVCVLAAVGIAATIGIAGYEIIVIKPLFTPSPCALACRSRAICLASDRGHPHCARIVLRRSAPFPLPGLAVLCAVPPPPSGCMPMRQLRLFLICVNLHVGACQALRVTTCTILPLPFSMDPTAAPSMTRTCVCPPPAHACMWGQAFRPLPVFFQESSFFSQDIYANTSTRVGSLLRRHAGR